MAKRVTLAQVAERAGVSAITASSVLARSKNARFSEGTRDRVLAASAELGYVPNALARSLRRGSTDTIGLYTGVDYADMRLEPFFGTLLSGLQRACDRHRKDLLLSGTFRKGSAESVLAEFEDGKIDGLVLLAPPHDLVAGRVRERRLPCVTVSERFEGLPNVRPDEERGMRLVAEHLAARGHRRAVFKGGLLGQGDSSIRAAAFRAAAEGLGIAMVPARPGEWDGDVSGDLALWRASPPEERATALVAWRDGVAWSALRACLAAGISVPGELAIVGYDGLPTFAPPALALTTVDAHWDRVGERAVEMLLGEGPLGAGASEVLGVDLVLGETA